MYITTGNGNLYCVLTGGKEVTKASVLTAITVMEFFPIPFINSISQMIPFTVRFIIHSYPKTVLARIKCFDLCPKLIFICFGNIKSISDLVVGAGRRLR